MKMDFIMLFMDHRNFNTMLFFKLKLFLNLEKCSQKICSPELELQLMKLGNVLDGGSLNRLHILALHSSTYYKVPKLLRLLHSNQTNMNAS